MTVTAGTDLVEGETVLETQDELLYRQICEWMIPHGEVLTYVFGPSSSDQGMPSYSRSSLVTAQESRDWHTENAASRSVGVWAVTVGEAASARTVVIDDAATPLDANQVRAPGHCFIDFRQMNKVQIKSARYLLYKSATDRREIPTRDTPEADQLF